MRHRDIQRAQREVAEERRARFARSNPHDGMPGRVRAGELEPHLVGQLVAVVDTVDDALRDERVERVEHPGPALPPARNSSSGATSSRSARSGRPAANHRRASTTAAMPMPSRWLSTTASTRSGGKPAARDVAEHRFLVTDGFGSRPQERVGRTARVDDDHSSLRLHDPDRLTDQHLAVGRRPRRRRPFDRLDLLGRETHDRGIERDVEVRHPSQLDLAHPEPCDRIHRLQSGSRRRSGPPTYWDDDARAVDPSAVPTIGDYALLGNCQGSALVSRSGSIDWACLPSFDSPAFFARILGEPGGFWSIGPARRRAMSSAATSRTRWSSPRDSTPTRAARR